MRINDEIYYMPGKGYKELAIITDIHLHVFYDEKRKKVITHSAYSAKYPSDMSTVKFCGYEIGPNKNVRLKNEESKIQQQSFLEDIREASRVAYECKAAEATKLADEAIDKLNEIINK